MKLGTMGIALWATVFVGCAGKQAPPPPAPEPAPTPPAAAAATALPAGTVQDETLTTSAKVWSVDRKTRHVTLTDADGRKFTVVAGPEVRNLAQMKKGDVVRISYHQSIAYEVKKPDKPTAGVTATSKRTRAAAGAKPSGVDSDAVTVRFTIAAIDKAASEASLRDPRGEVTVVKVKDPRKLDAVQVGDVVDVTYTEALAIAVESDGKR